MEEWKSYKLDDFIEFNPTISLKKGTMARKITMDQLTPHSRDIYSWGYEPYSGGAKFQNGDTIMARITPCLENGKHAFISLLDEGETAYGSTEYIVMRGKPGISDNRFVYYLSHYPDFKNAAIKSMVGSSGRQRAQVDVLKNLEFSLPGLEEQKQIADTLSALDDKIALNNRINHNLAA
jgi:type I restriction enzyme S subunit